MFLPLGTLAKKSRRTKFESSENLYEPDILWILRYGTFGTSKNGTILMLRG
jgi:hypothetical protein